MNVGRVRAAVWPVTTIVLSVLCTLLVMQSWSAGAAPGSSESTLVTIAPRRVLDTRDPVNVGLAGPFVSPLGQKLKVAGPVATTTGNAVVVPAGATGVLLNVTAVGATADGFISIRPGDATGAPATSSLNVTAGVTVPNAVTVSMPTSGPFAGHIDITFDAFGVAGPTTDILIDVVGYTTSAGLQELAVDVANQANALAQLQAEVAGKARAVQTVVFSGRDLRAVGTFETTNTNGCTATASDVNPALGQVPLVSLALPVGATILNVSATVYDRAAPAVHVVGLRRVVTGSNGAVSTTITSATNADANLIGQTAVHDLTPAPTEVVDPGERFEVSFDDGVNPGAGNGLCTISVTYEMPSAVGALGASAVPEVVAPADAAPIACEEDDCVFDES